MSDQPDEWAILVRLTPTLIGLHNDLDALAQWLTTITAQEQRILLTWAQHQASRREGQAARVVGDRRGS